MVALCRAFTRLPTRWSFADVPRACDDRCLSRVTSQMSRASAEQPGAGAPISHVCAWRFTIWRSGHDDKSATATAWTARGLIRARCSIQNPGMSERKSERGGPFPQSSGVCTKPLARRTLRVRCSDMKCASVGAGRSALRTPRGRRSGQTVPYLPVPNCEACFALPLVARRQTGPFWRRRCIENT